MKARTQDYLLSNWSPMQKGHRGLCTVHPFFCSSPFPPFAWVLCLFFFPLHCEKFRLEMCNKEATSALQKETEFFTLTYSQILLVCGVALSTVHQILQENVHFGLLLALLKLHSLNCTEQRLQHPEASFDPCHGASLLCSVSSSLRLDFLFALMIFFLSGLFSSVGRTGTDSILFFKSSTSCFNSWRTSCHSLEEAIPK